MSPRSIRRRYVLVSFLSWLPPGLMVAPQVLLMTTRGLDLADIGLVFAIGILHPSLRSGELLYRSRSAGSSDTKWERQLRP